MERWDADRLYADVERVGARGLPYAELHAELTARIRRVFPVDAACWHGLDPDTRLLTTANPVELMTAGFLTPETEAMVTMAPPPASAMTRAAALPHAGDRGDGRRRRRVQRVRP